MRPTKPATSIWCRLWVASKSTACSSTPATARDPDEARLTITALEDSELVLVDAAESEATKLVMPGLDPASTSSQDSCEG